MYLYVVNFNDMLSRNKNTKHEISRMLNVCLNTAFLVLLLFFFQLSQEVYCSCFVSNKYETQLLDEEEEYSL